MNAKETAIVFIEFQNDFCKEGGALYGGTRDQIKAQGTVVNARKCIEKARGKCLTLLVPIVFEPTYCDMGCQGVLGPIHANVVNTKAFQKGTWGGAIIDELGVPLNAPGSLTGIPPELLAKIDSQGTAAVL